MHMKVIIHSLGETDHDYYSFSPKYMILDHFDSTILNPDENFNTD